MKIDRATLYVPASDGRATRVDKMTCVDPDGVVHVGDRTWFVTSDGSRETLRCRDAAGAEKVRCRLPADDHLRAMKLSPQGDRLYLSTLRGAAVLRADSGALLGRWGYGEGTGFHRLALLPGGRVMCTGADRGAVLDSDLHPLRALPGGLDADRVEGLPDGSQLLVNSDFPSQARIVSADGQTRWDGKNLLHGTIRVDARGMVWVVGVAGAVTRVDSRTGQAVRMPAAPDAKAVVPLRDGSYLVRGASSLTLHAPDGHALADFPVPDRIQALLMREDEREAYAAVERKDGHALVRLPLHDAAPPEELYATHGDDGFVASLLADGRLAAYRRTAVDLLDAQGRILETLRGSEAPRLEAVGHRVMLGMETDPDPPGVVSDADLARCYYGYPHAETKLSLPSSGSVGRDGCVDFVSSSAAPVPMPLDSAPSTIDYSYRLVHDFPWPDGTPRTLSVNPTELVVRDDAQESPRVDFHVAPSHMFAAAMPLAAGAQGWVAAASSDGMLYVFDVNGPPVDSVTCFEVGAPVERLAYTSAGTVQAVGSDGRVLSVDLPLAPGGGVRSGL